MIVKKKTKSRAKAGSRKKTARKAIKKVARKKVAKKTARKKVAKKATRKKAAKKAKRKGGSSGLNKISYSVSKELQAIVGTQKLTRPQIVKKLWAYIKAHKCQDTKNRRLIVPDAKLGEVLGKKPVDMMKIAGLLSKHIQK